jgi:hypothetical protein
MPKLYKLNNFQFLKSAGRAGLKKWTKIFFRQNLTILTPIESP